MNKILAVAGDPGGARALIPVLTYLQEKNYPVAIVAYGVLDKECPKSWERIPWTSANPDALSQVLSESQANLLLFGTNIHDPFPLQLARQADQMGLSVVCLLDNWMNYRYRLEIDGKPTLIPHRYLVMDERARSEAINDGIPDERIVVTGQPALASLHTLYESFSGHTKPATGKKIITFISEPVSLDQGTDSSHKHFRGYTETSVLKSCIDSLIPWTHEVALFILPHPREDPRFLENLIQPYQDQLDITISTPSSHKEYVYHADGVAGMASLMLFEAWLIGKPVISLQPGLKNPHLNFMAERPDVFSISQVSNWDSVFQSWLQGVLKDTHPVNMRKEFTLHKNAAQLTGDTLISEFNIKETIKP